ncbi:MAG: DNA repair exonuclease, partial [Planctomycetota bacterium]
GDLYDGDWKDHNTGLFFVKQAQRLIDAGIRLVVIRGNHDAASQITKSLRLPNNADGSEILLSEKRPDQRTFEEQGFHVIGQSFANRHSSDDLTRHFPPPKLGLFNIGLLHTSLAGFSGHDPYHPTTPGQLNQLGYDYWALGHIHQPGNHGDADGAPIVFSGNTQGRHVGECGPRGCYIVDVDNVDKTPRMRFVTTDSVRWHVCRFDLTDVAEVDQVIAMTEEALRQLSDENPDRTMIVRIRVDGATTLQDDLIRHAETILGDLRSTALQIGGDRIWIESFRDRTVAPAGNWTAQDSATADAILQCLGRVMDTSDQDSGVVSAIHDRLSKLYAKLPRDLRGCDALCGDEAVGDGSFQKDITPKEWAERVAGLVQPMLRQRLKR